MSKKRARKKKATAKTAAAQTNQPKINPETILTEPQKASAAALLSYIMEQKGERVVTFSLSDGDKSVSRRVQIPASPTVKEKADVEKTLRNLIATGLCLSGCSNFQFPNPNVLSQLPLARVGFVFTDGMLFRMPTAILKSFVDSAKSDAEGIDFQLANVELPLFNRPLAAAG